VRGRIFSKLTYANVVATLAFFLALGGGAYAAFHLPKNSVKSKNIVNGQVKSSDVSDGLTFPAKLRLVDGSGGPGFGAGWENYGSGVEPASFFRDREGMVHLTGSVDQATITGAAIFTLPPGYRPAKEVEFGVLSVNSSSNKTIDQVEVQPEGDVFSFVNPGAFLSLAGIDFRCAPSGKNGCP
jgi:hypothetical protein